jgi:hypothetical protein
MACNAAVVIAKEVVRRDGVDIREVYVEKLNVGARWGSCEGS